MEIKLRDEKRKADWYRQQNLIPGVIYGKDFPTKSIYANKKDLLNFIQQHSGGIAEIKFEGKNIPVTLKEVQYHPLTDEIIHFDLYVPKLDKPVVVKIPLEFVGKAPAEEIGYFINFNLTGLEVEALPRDLPEKIIVDLSILKDVHQSIYVKDLQIPSQIKVLISKDNPVVTVVKKESVEEPITEETQTQISNK